MASYSEVIDFKSTKKTPKFLPVLPTAVLKHGNETSEETPIFAKRKMQLLIPKLYGGDFMHLTVSKNWLVCVLSGPPEISLLRFFLPRAIPPGEIPLEKYLAGYRISKVFLDPTGHHLLISLVPQSTGLSADFLYIHGNGPKVRRIEKFKDHEITAVAFNSYLGTESSTGPILLGTSRGLIFETELLQDADKPSYRKQVYDLGLGRPKYAITGLELLRMPNSNKYFVVTTTPDSIYTFQETLKMEEKSLQAIFTNYVNGTRAPVCEELKTDFKFSALRFFAEPNGKFPKQWAWLCADGIRNGEVSADVTGDALLLGKDLIALDLKQEEQFSAPPKSFVLSECHVLLLYTDHITAICLLNNEVVYQEHFPEKLGKLLNILRDPFTGAVYLYSEKAVFNYRTSNEKCNIWKIYLDKGNYDMAEVYAAQNPKRLDTVLATRAEAAFEQKQYEESARIYADTEKPFETICLKFIDLEDKRPIISYVKRCLTKLEEDSEGAMALIVWLIDLYLIQINYPGREQSERIYWQKQYDEFMREERVRKCTHANREAIKKLIAEHADSHNLSQLAISIGDYDEVINLQLSAQKYREALKTLCQQKNPELYYKYCPVLMEYLPRETVEALMMQERNLEIKQLLPTLIVGDSPLHTNEIMKYLEYAVYSLGETNEAVHNYLLRLYAEHKPAKLMPYLENEGSDVSLIRYDINYALSVCMENDAKVACVFLKRLLGMWTPAVNQALTFDVKLAKETAELQKDEDKRRDLWLRIAQHDIQGTNDVKKALNMLKECDLLRIEDLLPFFSDFEKIDDFKEAICDGLKIYNDRLQELQRDMDECSKQAERVSSDLKNLRERSMRIGAQELCSICESLLLIKPFFVFACGHKFHSDCLEKQVIPMLSSDTSRRLTMLKQEMEALLTQAVAAAQKKRHKLKTEIEKILVSDCLYCGLMIDTIDQPFVDDWDQGNVDWE